MAGSVLLALSALSEFLGSLFAVLVYLPLDFFVLLVEFFSKFDKFVIYKEVSLTFLIVYYIILGLFYIRSSKETQR